MSARHDPFVRGIFVQRNLQNKYATRYRKPFCVTFPRLANVTGKEGAEILFPSDDFFTFKQAHDFAIQIKKIDSRLGACPIFLLDFKWIKSCADRLLQRIG